MQKMQFILIGKLNNIPQGLKKTPFCVLRDELVRVKDELLTEEGRVVIYSLY